MGRSVAQGRSAAVISKWLSLAGLVLSDLAANRMARFGPKGGSVTKDRALATTDTLGNSRMWVKIEMT